LRVDDGLGHLNIADLHSLRVADAIYSGSDLFLGGFSLGRFLAKDPLFQLLQIGLARRILPSSPWWKYSIAGASGPLSE
jgi:hypothetical protein